MPHRQCINILIFLKMKKKIIFLDRDGVINKKMPDGDYVKNWAEFEFIPQALEALKILTDNNYKIFIITNQRGVARGLITEESLGKIHSNMETELRKEGINIEGIYYCVHDIKDNCECRKPKAGMIFRAVEEHSLDLSNAVFIGDSKSDIQAGEAAGCRTALIESGEDFLKVVKLLINDD